MERLGRAGRCLFAESEVCGHRARAGSVAPLHPLKGWRGSFTVRLGVFLKVERSVPMERLGRAGCRLFAESEVSAIARRRGASLPCIPTRGGEVLLLRGWAFLLRVAHSVPMERLGRAGRCLFAESEVCGHRARAGSVAPLHPLKGWRDSFAARLDVSIEGRACWFAFDELDVACLRNRRCATVARGRGASLPCIPSRGGEVLLLCGWAFLLRVKRVSLLMTSWMLLVCKLEVCDRRAKAGSVAPLHPLKGWRGSFVVLLGVSIEGKACWFAYDELDVARLRNRRCATIA